jgi:hypothetical protein
MSGSGAVLRFEDEGQLREALAANPSLADCNRPQHPNPTPEKSKSEGFKGLEGIQPLPDQEKPSESGLSETDFQNKVIRYAVAHGWMYYHTHDSRRSPSGFPDLVLVRERVVFLELKSDTGELSGAQKKFIQALRRAKAEIHWFRPGAMSEVERILT